MRSVEHTTGKPPIPVEWWDFDAIPIDYVEAVEVYQGLGIPIQYGPACGVVLLWTRGS